MKIEVLGTERRRRWSPQDKLQIVEETMQPGVTVTEVARRHGLAPSVVFTWRRLAREGRLGDAGPVFIAGRDHARAGADHACGILTAAHWLDRDRFEARATGSRGL
jgi:Transposase